VIDIGKYPRKRRYYVGGVCCVDSARHGTVELGGVCIVLSRSWDWQVPSQRVLVQRGRRWRTNTTLARHHRRRNAVQHPRPGQRPLQCVSLQCVQQNWMVAQQMFTIVPEPRR